MPEKPPAAACPRICSLRLAIDRLQRCFNRSAYLLERDGQDTLRAVKAVAAIAGTGIALPLILDNVSGSLARPRSPYLRTRRSEDYDGRTSERGGHVRRSTVIADEQSRARERGGELAETRALEPANRRSGEVFHLPEHGGLARPARIERRETQLSLNVRAEPRKILRRPLLRGIQRRWMEDGVVDPERNAQLAALFLPPRFVRRCDKEARSGNLAAGQPEPEERGGLMLGGMQRRLAEDQARVGNQEVVEPPRAEMFEARFPASAAQPRQQRARRAAVQVEAKHELPLPQRTDHSHSLAGFRPAAGILDGDHVVHVAVPFEQIAEARFDEHRDAEVVPPLLEK